MPNTATLAELRTRVLQASDCNGASSSAMQVIVPSGDYTELDGYINDSLTELFDLLVLRFENYFRQTTTMTLVSGQEKYQLPGNFYKEMAVFYLSGTARIPLKRVMINEIPFFQTAFLPPGNTDTVGYDIMGDAVLGDVILFVPIPSGGTVEIWYVPQCPKLVNASDTVAYSIVNGWEEFVVVDAAIKIVSQRLRLDSSTLERRKDSLMRRIQMAAQDRSISRPRRVVDVHLREGWRRRYYP